MSKPQILLCTVGTSLYTGRAKPGAPPPSPAAILAELRGLAPSERPCGAEINSIDSLLRKGLVADNVGLFFFHSDTDDGRAIGRLLGDYFRERGHAPADAVQIDGLNNNPRSFRTHGLRNLARQLCRVIREYGPGQCAINATGGFKAQVAIAVLLGQALGVQVFYKHETFDEIIAFPPMPVALDFSVWMRASGMLFDLERSREPIPAKAYQEEWNEQFENLVDRVAIDGEDYLELSPTGQIFHETFRERFRSVRDKVLPPPALKKIPPRLEKAGWPGEHPEIERFMRDVTEAIPQVVHCSTIYFNPDLPERTRFVESREGIVGIFSPSGFTVKFRVETSAMTPGQQAAVLAALNAWLAER